MNQEMIKLEKVKKSCGTVKKVAKIMMIIAIVATVLSLISGVITLAMGGDLNDRLADLDASGKVSFNTSITSKITAEFYEDDIAPLSIVLAIYTFECGIISAAVAVIMHMISSAFGIIENSESPFTDTAIKKLIMALIIVCIVIGAFGGIAYGILLGVITWAIYTILDYGRALQIQSDETL